MSVPLVSLVIPGRDCASTLEPCLDAALRVLTAEGSRLGEILFVDDGSRDASRSLAASRPEVRVLRGEGRGPGAARNQGWRAARHPLVWFVDSDCVIEPFALGALLEHMDDAGVGGVGGTYTNARPHALLACLIHEEIAERHLAMGREVDFLATFNVIYRRAALETVGGFDERFLKAQDAELAFRVLASGLRLRFDRRSRVAHFHEDRWLRYLRTQRQQGYWRVFLHMAHRGHGRGDSYSTWVDHAQPPLAVLAVASLGLWPLWATACGSHSWPFVVTGGLLGLLVLAQIPLTLRILKRLRRPRYLAFAWLGFLRSFWRGAGLVLGLWHYVLGRLR